MAKNPLVRLRKSAFDRQKGKCCYCGFVMWRDNPEGFAQHHKITLRQARHFQCTAEHLRARKDGGTDTSVNIAAACSLCNSRRHRYLSPLSPADYQVFVQKKVRKGGWHSCHPE